MISALPAILMVTANVQPAATAEAAPAPIDTAASVPTNEAAEQKPIFDAVRSSIERRDYQALNRLAGEFRKTRARTSSGIWKLSVFHWRVLTELGPKNDGADCSDRSETYVPLSMCSGRGLPSNPIRPQS